VSHAKTRATLSLVIDANVAVRAFTPEDVYSDQFKPEVRAARALLDECRERGIKLLVPPRFHSEIVTGIADLVVHDYLSKTQGRKALELLLSRKWRVKTPEPLKVLELCYLTQRKDAGDMTYLAIALAESCQVVSADKPFVRTCKQHIPKSPVRELLEYSLPR
jgi:predicted nucleic acid-binding protein